MEIKVKDWVGYVNRLRKINDKATDDLREYINSYGGKFEYSNPSYMKALVEQAYQCSTEYGEAAAELACQMYDEMGLCSGLLNDPAVPYATPSYNEVYNSMQAVIKRTQNIEAVASEAGRLVKKTAVKTTLQNAKRDGAEIAWVVHGDTCPFCIALASRGWKSTSNTDLDGEKIHIHANCDCTYAVRFNKNTRIEGYDPDKLYDMYKNAEGKNSKEKLNSLRRMHYEQNKDRINAQKRAAYAEKKGIKELAQHKKYDKVAITKQAIDKVKAIGPSSCTKEELQLIKNMNREILSVSKDKNNNNEVAMAIVNGKISNPVLGTQNKINLYSDTEMNHILRGKDAVFRSVTLSHNHPGLSYFSMSNMEIFTECPSIKTMEVVTNGGTTWYVSKKDNYDDIASFNELKKILRDSSIADEKKVATFLKSIYNTIERNR